MGLKNPGYTANRTAFQTEEFARWVLGIGVVGFGSSLAIGNICNRALLAMQQRSVPNANGTRGSPFSG
jgi:hypothetical protein